MSKRILILGNSITRHAPACTIGWYGDWGMAASAEEKDFVHILKRLAAPNVVIGINVASAERGYWELDKLSDSAEFMSALKFDPDIIVFRLGENVANDKLAEHSYIDGFRDMIDVFNAKGRAKIIVTTCFWESKAKDDAMRAVAAERNYPVVELGDLGRDPANKALGLFEHSGVAAHPGDAGMEAIASRIWETLKNYLD